MKQKPEGKGGRKGKRVGGREKCAYSQLHLIKNDTFKQPLNGVIELLE